MEERVEEEEDLSPSKIRFDRNANNDILYNYISNTNACSSSLGMAARISTLMSPLGFTQKNPAKGKYNQPQLADFVDPPSKPHEQPTDSDDNFPDDNFHHVISSDAIIFTSMADQLKDGPLPLMIVEEIEEMDSDSGMGMNPECQINHGSQSIGRDAVVEDGNERTVLVDERRDHDGTIGRDLEEEGENGMDEEEEEGGEENGPNLSTTSATRNGKRPPIGRQKGSRWNWGEEEEESEEEEARENDEKVTIRQKNKIAKQRNGGGEGKELKRHCEGNKKQKDRKKVAIGENKKKRRKRRFIFGTRKPKEGQEKSREVGEKQNKGNRRHYEDVMGEEVANMMDVEAIEGTSAEFDEQGNGIVGQNATGNELDGPEGAGDWLGKGKPTNGKEASAIEKKQQQQDRPTTTSSSRSISARRQMDQTRRREGSTPILAFGSGFLLDQHRLMAEAIRRPNATCKDFKTLLQFRARLIIARILPVESFMDGVPGKVAENVQQFYEGLKWAISEEEEENREDEEEGRGERAEEGNGTPRELTAENGDGEGDDRVVIKMGMEGGGVDD